MFPVKLVCISVYFVSSQVGAVFANTMNTQMSYKYLNFCHYRHYVPYESIMREHSIEFLKVASAMRRARNKKNIRYSFIDYNEHEVPWPELYKFVNFNKNK